QPAALHPPPDPPAAGGPRADRRRRDAPGRAPRARAPGPGRRPRGTSRGGRGAPRPPRGGRGRVVTGPRAELAALAARGLAWPDLPRVSGHPRPAAVLVLLGALDDRPAEHATPRVPADLDLLLVGRAASLAHHPGQVAFPGGRLDPGDDGP